LIGAPLLPSVKPTSKNAFGWEFLDSGNMLYSGRFVPLNTGSCPKAKLAGTGNLAKVTYMGVGFGRNVRESGIPYGTASHNPFRNVIRHSGGKRLSIRTGYTISTKGVYLGLTANNTAEARWVKLEKIISTDSRAWAPPLLSFILDNLTKPIQAQALIDTSVTQMYIQSSTKHPLSNVTIRDTKATPPAVRHLKPGTKLSFAFADFNPGVAGYELVVGDMKFPSQPSYVQPVTAGRRRL
jgi:hypothetical protein